MGYAFEIYECEGIPIRKIYVQNVIANETKLGVNTAAIAIPVVRNSM
jgi:hypothetical protein